MFPYPPLEWWMLWLGLMYVILGLAVALGLAYQEAVESHEACRPYEGLRWRELLGIIGFWPLIVFLGLVGMLIVWVRDKF